ncbi:MAG: arginine--tRNA ligase [Candidatus Aenigmatarchaeota archaeon]
MNLKLEIKKEVEKILRTSSLLEYDEIIETLEEPPSPEMGDLSTNISFRLANKLRKSPVKISEDIFKEINIQKNPLIDRIETKNGYINFFFNYENLAEKLLKSILKEGERYGSSDIGKGKEVLIEYSAPNPNKPMHIGHIRNNFIGMSLVKILDFSGYKTHPVNWINDRGAHICKSLWGYLQFGRKNGNEIRNWKILLKEWTKKPDDWFKPTDIGKKPDHFVMDFYVKANNLMEEIEEYEKENREILKEWEEGNPDVRKLWKTLNEWVYEGWQETYKRQGCVFERFYFESDLYNRGKEIVMENMKNGIFKKTEKGTIIADLEKHGLPGLVFIRSDGTSLYSTADIALTERKVKDYPNSKLIWVVGNAQNLYFQQLFTLFELIGIVRKENCYHLGYGMVSLPEGKMSSRKGTVVLADDVMDRVKEMVEKEIEERNQDIEEDKKSEIAEKISLGAIKFAMLKVDAFKDIVFNPKEVISFEGKTGPYLQYSYVRAEKILQKAGKFKEKFESKLTVEEINLIKKLMEFPEIVEKASKEYKPNLIANYGFELAEMFNVFYQKCPVLHTEEEKEFRLTLVKSFKITIKNCMNLLGIETPELM